MQDLIPDIDPASISIDMSMEVDEADEASSKYNKTLLGNRLVVL